FGNRDCRKQRGVFKHVNEEVSRSRDDWRNHLRDNDASINFKARKAEGGHRVPLPVRNGFEARTIDFRHVTAVMSGDRDDPGDERRERDTKIWHDKKEKINLDKEGC